jgi:hypothetical protein
MRAEQKAKRKAGQRRPGHFAFSLSKASAPRLHHRSGLKNQNPQNGPHRARFDWGLGADCFGASPVASALDLPQERDSPKNRIQTNMRFLQASSKPDISTLQRIGHFYFALTRSQAALSACL